MGEQANCCLCAEIASGEFPVAYREVYPISQRIVALKPDFLAMPTLSPLVSGHVLVLPKEHVKSLADLSEQMRLRLLEAVRQVMSTLKQRFSEPLYFFEHGARTTGMACGIDHAHLHILPLSAEVIKAVEAQVDTDFRPSSDGNLLDILSLAARRPTEPYLLRGTHSKTMQITFSISIRSQYMRQVIAEALGEPSWDWKSLGRSDHFRSTVQALESSPASA